MEVVLGNFDMSWFAEKLLDLFLKISDMGSFNKLEADMDMISSILVFFSTESKMGGSSSKITLDEDSVKSLGEFLKGKFRNEIELGDCYETGFGSNISKK